MLYISIINIIIINYMSIYSGFSTRKTETLYNSIILKSLELINSQLLYYIQRDQSKDNLIIFSDRIFKIVNKLKSMQERKYLPPRFAESFNQLIDMLRSKIYICNPVQQMYNNKQSQNSQNKIFNQQIFSHPLQQSQQFQKNTKNKLKYISRTHNNTIRREDQQKETKQFQNLKNDSMIDYRKTFGTNNNFVERHNMILRRKAIQSQYNSRVITQQFREENENQQRKFFESQTKPKIAFLQKIKQRIRTQKSLEQTKKMSVSTVNPFNLISRKDSLRLEDKQ